MLFNPLMVEILIPIFTLGIYLLLAKIGINRSWQKLTIGGFLAAFAVALQAMLQWQIEQHILASATVFGADSR